ncbi:hypothetical protein BAY1663_00219 [Pseudomonas sp. BAY1663]|nr:hypothetical protein BAY1663_00219 [Pseudomonas sp. BAY1663]
MFEFAAQAGFELPGCGGGAAAEDQIRTEEFAGAQ